MSLLYVFTSTLLFFPFFQVQFDAFSEKPIGSQIETTFWKKPAKNLQADCDSTFIRRYGSDGVSEDGWYLLQVPGGNFIVGARLDDRSLLMMLDGAGNIIWQRAFDFTAGDDFIKNLMLDSEGYLIGSARDQVNAPTANIVFRYDYQNDIFLWVRSLSQPAWTRIEGILENPVNGNYILYGTTNPNPFDNYILEVDRNTGAPQWQRSYDYGGNADVLQGHVIHGTGIYFANVVRLGLGMDEIRASIAKMDFSGNLCWTRSYFNTPAQSARTYSHDILLESDTLVSVGRGSLVGDDLTFSTMQLFKTDLDGEIYWARHYDIVGGSRVEGYRLLSIPDGYILQGNYIRNGAYDVFFARVDKNGNVIWAKRVGTDEEDFAWTAALAGDFVVFTAATAGLDPGNQDILFGKISLDGNVSSEGCDLIEDIQMTVSDIVNPYDGLEQPDVQSPLYSWDVVTASSSVVNLEVSDVEGCECQEPIGDCDTSFLITYGSLQDNEQGYVVLDIPANLGGGFLVGGSKADSAMIMLLDESANVVWTHAFDITPDENDYILRLMLDSDNNVVAVGETKVTPGQNIEAFAFKYDFQNNIMLWLTGIETPNPSQEGHRAILEKSPGGNYLVVGQTNLLQGGVGCDALVFELDRNTGTTVWQKSYHLGSCETFHQAILHNNNLYAVGRHIPTPSGSFDKMRASVTRLDFFGNQQWSKLYINPPNADARMYAQDVVEDNDGLIIYGHGDKSGATNTNVSMFLFRTDFDGNLEWAMEYDIPGANSEWSTRMLNLPDGYLCLGYFTDGDKDAFIFKTDKQGQLQWSKAFGGSGAEDAFDMFWRNNGLVYFTGKTTSVGSSISEDIYLASLSLDETSAAQDSCDYFSDLSMTATPFPNPYEGLHNLTVTTNSDPFLQGSPVLVETSLQQTFACFQSCPDSPEISDAMIENASAICNGSQFVSLTICNLVGDTLPANTPISFYAGNPTTSPATLLNTVELGETLATDSCRTLAFFFTVPMGVQIYAVVNDAGTTPTPFNLTTDFPNTNIPETDFTNNIGSFLFEFTPPVLDLGPDTTQVCIFDPVVLDAGSDFFSYLWQNGSTEQTFVAISPGLYWVEVTDSCGGTQQDTVLLGFDAGPALEIGINSVELCAGESVTFTVSGFDNYSWSPSDYLDCDICDTVTATPGTTTTYYLTATTVEGCVGIDSVTVEVLPETNTSESILICSGDSIEIFGNFESQAGDYSQTFSGANGCDSTHTVTLVVLDPVITFDTIQICFGDSVEIFGNFETQAGDYSHVFTGSNGCDSTHVVTLKVGDEILIDFEIKNACFVEFDGQIIATASGGAGGFTFQWNQPVGNVDTLLNLAPGNYDLTVTDANGCTASATAVVDLFPPFNVIGLPHEPSCFGGSDGFIDITLSGGTGEPFSILWFNGTTSSTITGLSAGVYGLTVTDTGSGCTLSVSAILNEPPLLEASATGTDATCAGNDGTATANATGGATPYSFAWSNNATGQNITGLAAGTYIVTVTDDNGCTATASVTIGGTSGPSVSITVTSPVSSVGASDGALTAQISGGAAPYQISWSNGAASAAITGLSSGNYSVTVTDANGCTATATATLFVGGCIGDRIWNDVDRDGCQDGGEIGMANVKLTLSGTDIFGNAASMITTTAPNGQYKFNGLAPGTYQVTIQTPPNFSHSPANSCINDFTDSDFNASGSSGNVTIAEGQCNIILDGGLYNSCLNVSTPGTICCDQTLCGPGVDPAPIGSGTPASGGVGTIQYMWMYSHDSPFFGNGTWVPIAGATGPTYDPGPIYQTTYFARCAKIAGCTVWLESNIVTITVADVAVAEISAPGMICVGNQVTFSTPNNGPGATYSWNFGSWATPSTSNQPTVNVTWNQAGVVYVTLTVENNGCTSTDVLGIAVSNSPVYCAGMMIINPGNSTSVADAEEAQFQVYPNPVNDYITVAYNEAVKTAVKMEVLAMDGRLLRSETMSEGAFSHSFDLHDLLPGAYLIRLTYNEGERKVLRLVKN